MAVFVKDPAAVIDYTVNWSDWLSVSEEIDTSIWSVSPSGLTIVSDLEDADSATVFVSGGTVGKVYRLVNQIVTDQGRTEERAVIVRVEQQ